MGRTPEGYEPKTVISVIRDQDGIGWLVTLSCGHVVWNAIRSTVGAPHYCGDCVDGILTAFRGTPSPLITEPDPENYWTFLVGQTRMIGLKPKLLFRLDSIHDTWIVGTETMGGAKIGGELHLNHSVVLMKTAAGEPTVTLTLRRIANDTAYIQVSLAPGATHVARAAVQ